MKKNLKMTYILKRGMGWNKLELPGMSWNYLDRLRHLRHVIAHARLCTRLKHYRRAKKSMPCLIKKASRCATDRTSKMFFIFHFLYNTKILRENHVYLWLVQWWKLYYIYIFFTQRATDFGRLKRNMNDGTIIFWCLYPLP